MSQSHDAPPPSATVTSGYGVHDETGMHPMTRPALLDRVRSGTLPPRVWTPEHAMTVPPEDVPYLFEVMRERFIDAARWQALILALVIGGIAALAGRGGGLTLGSPAVVYLLIGTVWVGMAVREWIAARRLTVEGYREKRRASEAAARVHAEPVVYVRWMEGCVATAGAAQVIAMITGSPEYGIQAGALSSDAVMAGQWWRLLTAAFLHINFIHFFLNFSALTTLSRETEVLAHRAFVPLVFLAAALAGGILSLILPPDVPSVGASGGILGFIGFLGVLGVRRRETLPPGFLTNVLINVAMVAGMGIAGYQFIDNAAHLGGLLAGTIIGLVTIPTVAARPEWTPGPVVRRLGDVSLGVIALATLGTVCVLLAAGMGM